MLSLTLLGSGSGGNCALIITENCRVLIDAGFSARQICQRLQAVGVAPETLDAILLTHEHGDHVTGLEVFCRKYPVPIYCNPRTAESLRLDGLAEFSSWRFFETGSVFLLKDLEVQTFYVPHDAVDPVAFVFANGAGAIGFLTDLGYAPRLALERLREVHTLVIETNHDERMLQDDMKRPWSVKQRILSRHGHLSNAAAARLVADIGGKHLSRVILGHLSRECNRPELALSAMQALGAVELEFYCASQHQVSPQFRVEPKTRLPVSEQITPVDYNQRRQCYSQGFFDLEPF
jgi:phosphoribosyl 1,2-cyclic phosphodiesterase